VVLGDHVLILGGIFAGEEGDAGRMAEVDDDGAGAVLEAVEAGDGFAGWCFGAGAFLGVSAVRFGAAGLFLFRGELVGHRISPGEKEKALTGEPARALFSLSAWSVAEGHHISGGVEGMKSSVKRNGLSEMRFLCLGRDRNFREERFWADALGLVYLVVW